MTYTWSADEESFQGEHDTIEGALNDAVEYLSDYHEAGVSVPVWVGEIVSPRVSLERVVNANALGEWILETVEEWMLEAIPTDGDEILSLGEGETTQLGRLVMRYLKTHAQFHAWAVEHVKEHRVTIPQGE